MNENHSKEGWTLDRIVDGKIVEHRTIDDVMTMMRQLGVIPAPGHNGN